MPTHEHMPHRLHRNSGDKNLINDDLIQLQNLSSISIKMHRNWRYLSLLLCLLIISHKCCSSTAKNEEEDDLLEDLDLEDAQFTDGLSHNHKIFKHLVDLIDANVEEVIRSHERVLLLGYASWCTRSSAMMPEYGAAAVALNESGVPVLLAKMEAIVNDRAAKKYDIKGFPTLLFFTNGTPEVYNGGDSKDEIVNWVKKRTGFQTTRLSSISQAKEYLEKNITLVCGLFDKFEGTAYEEFVKAAREELGTEFVEIADINIARVFNPDIKDISPFIWVQKPKPEYFVPFYGDYNGNEILKFVEINKHPLVIKLHSGSATKVYSSPINHQVLLFAELGDHEKIIPFFEELSKEYKGKMLFLLVDNSDEDFSQPMLHMYGLHPGEPVVAGFNNGNGQKYLLRDEVNAENLKVFCSKLYAGDLPQFYKSELPPAENEGDVKVVVGDTFNEIVLDETKDVLLEVYTPWCIMCDKANKLIENLGRVLRHVPSVTIAKIDGSANEHPSLQVDNYPELLFYAAGERTSKPHVVSLKLGLKGLIQYLVNNAAVPFSIPTESTKDSEPTTKKVKKKLTNKDEL